MVLVGAFVGLVAIASPTFAQTPAPLAVEVTNASEPVLCAEKDNVTINLASKDVRRLRIEAAHPAYIGTIQRDVAQHCLDRLASLGPYGFDIALGESQVLTFDRWISKADMAAHIAGLPHEANSGDVYCVLQA